MTKNVPWNTAEVKVLLARSHAGYSIKSTAQLLGRSVNSIRSKMDHDGIRLGWKAPRGAGPLPGCYVRINRELWNWVEREAVANDLPIGVFLRKLVESLVVERMKKEQRAERQ